MHNLEQSSRRPLHSDSVLLWIKIGRAAGLLASVPGSPTEKEKPALQTTTAAFGRDCVNVAIVPPLTG